MSGRCEFNQQDICDNIQAVDTEANHELSRCVDAVFCHGSKAEIFELKNLTNKEGYAETKSADEADLLSSKHITKNSVNDT